MRGKIVYKPQLSGEEIRHGIVKCGEKIEYKPQRPGEEIRYEIVKCGEKIE